MLAELAKREEVKRTGVYCLLGPDPENPARDMVYLGEGDNVFKRLKVQGMSPVFLRRNERKDAKAQGRKGRTRRCSTIHSVRGL